MRREDMTKAWAVKVLCVSLAIVAVSVVGIDRSDAAKPTRPGGRSIKLMTTTPTETLSPVTSENHMRVCVSGFDEGNFVSIGVPWVGRPDSYSMLSFSQYVDASGGFCIDAPPGRTEMNLLPGAYSTT